MLEFGALTTPMPVSLGQLMLAPVASHDADPLPMPAHSTVDRSGPDWKRSDGSQKGDGFLGLLKRPDGGVMSEFSMAESEDPHLKIGATTGYMDYPSLVPTLSAQEVNILLHSKAGERLPDSIKQKAEAFALARIKAGLPVFAQPGEADYSIHPQFPRAQ